MSETHELRVGVVGAGLIGLAHIRRLSTAIKGARVTALVEPAADRLAEALAAAPGAVAVTSPQELIDRDDVDALVVATPGHLHEPVVLAGLEQGLPMFVEKPLARDSASALRMAQAEAALGRRLVQVGFMRRYDAEYRRLRELTDSETHGRLLMLHQAHRLGTYRAGATAAMPLTDALVHEVDVAQWLLGEPFVQVEVKRGLQNRLADPALIDPQLVLLQTASGHLVTVEINVSVQFGYQVTTEAVFEAAVVTCGRGSGPVVHAEGAWGGTVDTTYATRFEAAFASQLQRWVDAAHGGGAAADGASAWDGYTATAVAEAAVRSQTSGGPEAVELAERPGSP